QDTARKILQSPCEIVLPLDVVVAEKIEENAPHRVCKTSEVKPHEMILDLGPLSINNITEKMGHCKTLLWNGPLGVFETPPFDIGAHDAAHSAVKLTRLDYLTSIAGGGDTVAALQAVDALNGMSYVSTAGGAFLEYIEGKDLPGVKALKG